MNQSETYLMTAVKSHPDAAIAYILGAVEPDMFADSKARVIVAAGVMLRNDGVECLIQEQLRDKIATLEATTRDVDATALFDCLSDQQGFDHGRMDHHLAQVEDAALRRKLGAAEGLIRDAAASKGSAREAIEDVVSRLTSVVSRSSAPKARPMGELLSDLHRAMAQGVKAVPSLRTGVMDFDQHAGGIPTRGLTLVAARPSNGKTAFLNMLAAELSMDGGVVLYCSLEVSADEVARNMVAREGSIPLSEFNRHKLGLPEVHAESMDRVSARFSSARITVWAPDQATTAQIESEALRVMFHHGEITAILVDYVQLIRAPKLGRNANREQEVAAISRDLKRIQRRFKCAMVVAAQLNRESTRRAGFKPRVSDLRESGSLEQDADMVILLHRPCIADTEEEDKTRAEIIIGKNRNGPVGEIPAEFIGPCVRWQDPSASSEWGL